MNPRNLSEYYQSIGQALPSVAQRQEVASQAGIQGYRGTASQNAQLLSYLVGQQSTPAPQTGRPNPFVSQQAPATNAQPQNQINLGQVDFGVIPSDNLFPRTPELSQTTQTTSELQGFSPTTDFSTDSLLQERQRLQQDITELEGRLSNIALSREEAYKEAGLFDDIRRLTDLRAEQRRIEDRDIEIPIEARQQLRGRGATITEFDQTTSPRLEDNLLRTLANTRQVSSLTDVINTQQAIIDSRIDEEYRVNTMMYEQRVSRLNQIEGLYYDVMTNEQKNALELAKASAGFNIGQSEFTKDIVKSQLNTLLESGINVNPNATSEQISQQYSDLLNSKRDLRVEAIGTTISIIDDLLQRTGALSANVGVSGLSRGIFSGISGAWAGVSGEAKQWRNDLSNLLTNQTFQKLGEITEETSLGAISEGELALVRAAASKISQMANGKVDVSEKVFIKEMNTIKNAQLKIAIREMLGGQAYTAAGVKDENDQAKLQDLYNDLNEIIRISAQERLSREEMGFSNVGNGTNSVTSSLLKQLEGFSTTAYRDGAGWSIGYGNQTHPDGTPVRQGDRIDPSQGDRYLQSALQSHSNWKNLVTVPLTEPQQAALASFEYNLGSGIWQGTTARQIINAINNRNFTQAAQLMQQFNKSQGRTLPVLVARRQIEGQLLTGNYA